MNLVYVEPCTTYTSETCIVPPRATAVGVASRPSRLELTAGSFRDVVLRARNSDPGFYHSAENPGRSSGRGTRSLIRDRGPRARRAQRAGILFGRKEEMPKLW